MKNKFNLILPIATIICLVGTLGLCIYGMVTNASITGYGPVGNMIVWIIFLFSFVILPIIPCIYAWIKHDWTKED